MSALVAPYLPALAASVLLALLILVQFVVLDVSQIRARHVPGTPVTGGHDQFLFRASRAHANTNENLGLYLLLLVCAILLGASPAATGAAAWAFVAARAGHMAFYYADWRTARSVAFGIGSLAQVALLVLCLIALVRPAAG